MKEEDDEQRLREVAQRVNQRVGTTLLRPVQNPEDAPGYYVLRPEEDPETHSMEVDQPVLKETTDSRWQTADEASDHLAPSPSP